MIIVVLVFFCWMLEQHRDLKALTFWGWCVVVLSAFGILLWVLHCLGIVPHLPACVTG